MIKGNESLSVLEMLYQISLRGQEISQFVNRLVREIGHLRAEQDEELDFEDEDYEDDLDEGYDD